MLFAEVRKLRKKLRQIENLERLDRELTEEESKKVSSKHSVRLLLQQLTAGNVEELSTGVLGGKFTDVSCDSSTEPTSTTAGEELTDSEDVSYESCPVTSETIKHDCVPVSLHLKEDNVGGSPKQRTIHSVMLETHRESNSDATAEEDEQERDDLSRGSVLQNTPQDSAHETGPSEFKDYDVTGNVNESHSDDMVDNKMEHSCTFVVEQLYGHNGIVRTVSLIDDFLVTGSQDTTVKIWKISTGVELRSLGGHSQTVTAALMLDLETSRRLAESLRQADEYAADSSSLPSEESYIILSAALDCTVRIWSFETGVCLKSVYTYHPLTSLSFMYCSSLIVCGSDGGKLELWSPSECAAPIESVLVHEDAITSLAVNGSHVYCGSADGLLSIYKWSSTDNCLHRLFESSDAKCGNGSLLCHRRIHCIAVSDETVYYGDDGMNVKVLQWKTGVVSKLSNHTTEFGSTRGLCLTNDLLISSGYDLDNGIGYINVRCVRDGRYLYTLCDVQTGYIQSVACSCVSKDRIVIVTGGQELKVWIQTPNEFLTAPSRGEIVKSMFVSWFDKEARQSDIESDSDADDSESSSSEPSLPWHQTPQIGTKTGWFSWCALL